jgi:DNA ligase 1
MQPDLGPQAQAAAPLCPQASSRPPSQAHEGLLGAGLTRRHTLAALLMGPCGALTAWAQHASLKQAVVDSAQVAVSLPVPVSVQLAMPWPQTRSPQGFLVSEKLDGVRAVWDGRVLRFRSGRVIAAPAWFLSALPPVALDGELWIGRGAFDWLSGVVRQATPDDQAWRAVTYRVFDAPGHVGVFAERMRWLQATLQAANQAVNVPWLLPVTQEVLKDAPALQALLQDTVRQGGEGLVLHRADALWRPGRSDALYKFKPEADEEGQVVGYQAGKGRLTGMTGALWLQTPTGQRFALGAGLSDALRQNPPPIGAWVTYRYRDRTPSGLPRFASFLRVREPE